MTRRHKIITIIAFVICLIYVSFPTCAKWYVEYKFPFVKINKVSYIWGGLRFQQISVDKAVPLVIGSIDSIDFFLFKKKINIFGNTIKIILSPKDTNNKTTLYQNALAKWTIYAECKTAVIERNKIRVKLSNISYIKHNSLNEFTLKNGKISYKDSVLYIENAKFSRNLEKINISKVWTISSLPIKIPGIKTSFSKLEARDIIFHPHERKITAKYFNYNFLSGKNIELMFAKTEVVITLKKLFINHKWLGEHRVVFHEIIFAFSAHTYKGIIFIGPSRLRLDFDLNNKSLFGQDECSDWIRAFPEPMPAALKEVAKSYRGNVSVFVAIEPKPDFKLSGNCSFRCSQSPIKELFNTNGFSYIAYHPDGSPFMRHVEPNGKDWVSISAIPPQLAMAVSALEDPLFQIHKGILSSAIKNSLLTNLKTGKFTRGGSTITMQLAKNLWLNRNKTIVRKAHEAMLTFALESCLTKEQILEYYLNVVEFGPNVYGIKAGAAYYFHKFPTQLTTDEIFYLAMILPHPNHTTHPNNGGLEKASSLIKKLTKTGILIDDEIE